MQNNNYDNVDKVNEDESQTLSKKSELPSQGQTTVSGDLAMNSSNATNTNSQSQNLVLANSAKTALTNELNTKISHESLKSSIKSTKKARKNLRAKKRKKTQEEVNILEAYFTKDPSWSRKTVKELKGELPCLTVDQIYKWGYDKKLLLKKYKAQEKAKKSTTEVPQLKQEPEVTLKEVKISDFNLEVDELCRLESTSTQDSTPESPASAPMVRSAPPTRRNSHLASSDGAPTLPTAATDDFAVLEDDPFFYERKDEAVFYVVINGSNKARTRRKGLFRVPSGFANMDFYTYKDYAFQKESDKTFLGELYKED